MSAPAMEAEEVRIRSLHLFLACSQLVEQFTDRLLLALPSPTLSVQVTARKALRRELGLLFRYWTTRQIWQRLDRREADAKQLNLTLLRLFTQAFQLPRDGSGLRYAEISSPGDELAELTQRLGNALGAEHPPLISELQAGMLPCREAVFASITASLERPFDELAAEVKASGGPAQGDGG